MAETSGSSTVSTKQHRIAELAKQMATATLTSLSQHIDIDWMHEAYERTRKDGAPGVDGQTAAEYAVNLEDNLRSPEARNSTSTAMDSLFIGKQRSDLLVQTPVV